MKSRLIGGVHGIHEFLPNQQIGPIVGIRCKPPASRVLGRCQQINNASRGGDTRPIVLIVGGKNDHCRKNAYDTSMRYAQNSHVMECGTWKYVEMTLSDD